MKGIKIIQRCETEGCNASFETKRLTSRFCPKCIKQRRKDHLKKLHEERKLDIVEKPTKVICPHCGKIHEKTMEWTGRGIPKIFCSSCKFLTRGYNQESFKIISRA